MTQSSMRTPLGRVRGLGSAKSGTGHFWLQRMTAVSNLVLTIIFIGIVISLSGRPYPAAMALLGHPLVSILMLLFILSACVHMRIGMQTILEDYVHHEGFKVLTAMANTFFAIAVGAASVYAVLKLSFGG
ncbi:MULTISPECIES: succinate dehydrogenase, hydrophobic membrane anchor protein [unclassified Bosea (in: a-proteobacteria)]|uniref:succinate dehydrogenase, hydrophobic membrane anchor protein n=1 Tax=unclassified Bosea (in: a-proteobacteria) TaxID=2653178 RepID=UPI0009550674|nr:MULTISPECIES: succinate dehydrogenase, hydrophobic membrane anchor protein [unclassified Bosea (in: a-proteobacteria)]SIR32781.1 succinate dehydrogenase subunit D [Bosea sp. TND4EK4]